MCVENGNGVNENKREKEGRNAIKRDESEKQKEVTKADKTKKLEARKRGKAANQKTRVKVPFYPLGGRRSVVGSSQPPPRSWRSSLLRLFF